LISLIASRVAPRRRRPTKFRPLDLVALGRHHVGGDVLRDARQAPDDRTLADAT
jgi:hypothetical protein